MSSSTQAAISSESITSMGGQSFLDKLYTILEKEPQDIISWSDSGDTFIIFDTERFATQVMSKYFKSTKFNSFVRQLNFYGFKKTTRDPSSDDKSPASRFWEFRHKLFMRGRKDLIGGIHRKQMGDSENDLELRVSELEREVDYLLSRISNDYQWRVCICISTIEVIIV